MLENVLFFPSSCLVWSPNCILTKKIKKTFWDFVNYKKENWETAEVFDPTSSREDEEEGHGLPVTSLSSAFRPVSVFKLWEALQSLSADV